MRVSTVPFVTAALLASGLVAPVLAQATTTESQFVSDTNHARSSHSLHRYGVPSDLTSVARNWARHMARARTLQHNPNEYQQVCCWSSIGENVGVGSSEGQIERAFMGSSSHRGNILSRTFTQVGIGTARGSDGKLYVDEVFRRPSSHSSAVSAVVPAYLRPDGVLRRRDA
jgi:uncharacterized protein YkwD